MCEILHAITNVLNVTSMEDLGKRCSTIAGKPTAAAYVKVAMEVMEATGHLVAPCIGTMLTSTMSAVRASGTSKLQQTLRQ
jgi:hypothetical protein